MNSMRIIALALLMCGVGCGVGAALSIAQGRAFERTAVRTQAVISDFLPFGENGRLVPYVRFADEQGNEVHVRAQRRGTRGLEVGDEVSIIYSQKKVFGQKVWNVFVLKDGNAKPYGLYTAIGAVLAALAAAMLAGAAFLLLR